MPPTAAQLAPKHAAAGIRPAAPVAVEPVGLLTRRVRLRWSLSRRALAGRRPELDLGTSDRPVILECSVAMEWTPGAPAPHAAPPLYRFAARLVEDHGDRALELLALTEEATTSGSWTADARHGLEHVDLPGLVALSFRVAPAAADHGSEAPRRLDVLYARTAVIDGLGLPGGRYQLVSGAWEQYGFQ